MQITLTSDMGNQNSALAVLRSNLCVAIPKVSLIDITHDIPLGMHIQAVYHLKSSLYYFPKNTIHIVLVDLFNNLESFLLLAQYEQQYYIAPNNGILSMLLPKEKFIFIKALPLKIASNNMIHTQVIFNTIILGVTKIMQQEAIENFTKEDFSFVEKIFPRPIQKYETDAKGNTINSIIAHIIFIDHFGNLVININIEEFLQYQKSKLKIVLKERFEIHQISKHYNDVRRGDLVAFFNANGFLEIAINGSSLALQQGFLQEQTNIDNSQFSFDINGYYKNIRIEFFD